MFLSTKQMSEKWGISPIRITILANEGRIPGAVKISSHWMIPDDAEKPGDGRKREVAKTEKSEDLSFRYPFFEGRNPDSFNPPLSESELKLKGTAELFHACRFEDAEIFLGDMYETEKNRYFRIYALYLACMIFFTVNKKAEFFDCYGKLLKELNDDFPRKKELSNMIHEIDSVLGIPSYFATKFDFDCDYPYHESYTSHLAYLSIVALDSSDMSHLTAKELLPFEIICSTMEKSGNYVDMLSIHFYLGFFYGSSKEYKKMKYHYRKAFEICEKHELYFSASVLYYYYGKSLDSVLPEFPGSFAEHIRFLSKDIHTRYGKFLSSASMNSIHNLIGSNDYIYIHLAVKGYSNADVAELMRCSDATVERRYSDIFKLTGVKTKAQLVKYYNRSIEGSPRT